MTRQEFQKILKERVLIFDGGLGTLIQAAGLTAGDFGGKEGCNEYLIISRPDVIENVHARYFQAGCDVVETDTFGANRIVLAEYGLAERTFELNKTAVQLARRVAQQFSTKAQPRWVCGSMGPSSKLPTLGHISFSEMRAAFEEQASGLLAGGVDLIVIETCQDILQAKAAVLGVLDAAQRAKKCVPLLVNITIERTGTMLLGTDVQSALTTLQTLDVDAVGMNCATGPAEMAPHIRTLCEWSRKPVSCLPNAGIPENVGGQAVYRLTPEELASALYGFVTQYGVNIVGGCCGTTPEHLAAVCRKLKGVSPQPRTPHHAASVSSLYGSVRLMQEPPPLLIGERTNANGSKQFKQLLEAQDFDGMVAMAKAQEQEGAHVLDVCVAFAGRNETHDMKEVIRRFVTATSLPIMVDSTNLETIEEALRLIPGKPIINSVNLEDGDKLDKIARLAHRFGAALVALTIDEEGMAKTAEKKFAVAKRLIELLTKRYGIPAEDILIDPLTFTLASGDEAFLNSAVETLNAIKLTKKEWPEVKTLLGVSNVSFGLAPHLRQVVNSIFLHQAIEAGLDAAIVHAQKILPLHKIDESGRRFAEDLLLNKHCVGYDPLKDLIAYYTQRTSARSESAAAARQDESIEEKLKRRILDGNRQGLEADLEEARKKYPPLEIINSILLEGMKEVGELFGSGRLQLPFVLQAAETMKAAVQSLQPFMARGAGAAKGKIVLATVKGDVHDIGKNLVDILLSNNGYTVYNIGIKQTIDSIAKEAVEKSVDAIGMSGLLVQSTYVMKENLEELNRRGLNHIPVLLGGAALTQRYVEEDLKKIYKGRVFYCKDAFAGLYVMENVAREKSRV